MPNLIAGNRSYAEQYIGSGGTLTKSHTVAAGTNRLLRVKTALQEVSGAPAISGITYNGVALTAVPNSEQNPGVTWERVQWWYLIGPATGANNLVLTMSGGGATSNMQIVIDDVSNHDGNAPVGNFKAYGTNVTSVNTGSIAYTDGDSIAVATVHGTNGKTVSWTNATEYDDADWQSQHSSSAFATQSGSGNVTITATVSATEGRVAISAIRISPAAAAPSWIATPANPYPGQTVNLALSNYASAPLSANCTYGGVAITLNGGATNTAASFVMPARSAFRFGGGHAAKRFNTNYSLVIANASESSTANMQVVPQQPGGFGARSAVAQSNTPMGDVINLGTWNSGAIVVATGDEIWGHIVSGSGVVNAPEVNYDAYSDPLVIDWTYYDISAGSWSGLTTTTYTEARTLTSADTTLTPDQTVRLTLSSAFSGAITAAKAVYGAVTMPITWAVVSSTLVDVTMPLLAECIASGSLVQLPWDTNFVLRLEASAESAETPSNNQMVAAAPANYGTIGVGPWAVTPVGAQQGDKVYAELLIGTGTFALATLTYTPTTPSVYRYYIFNVATQRWLDGYISGIAARWAGLRFAS